MLTFKELTKEGLNTLYYPNEETITVYVCGNSRSIKFKDNKTRIIYGIGFHYDYDKEYKVSKHITAFTNIQNHFYSVIYALRHIIKTTSQFTTTHDINVIIKANSNLLIDELRGNFEDNNNEILNCYKIIKELVGYFKSVTFEYIATFNNVKAIELSRKAIDDYLTKKNQFINNNWIDLLKELYNLPNNKFNYFIETIKDVETKEDLREIIEQIENNFNDTYR